MVIVNPDIEECAKEYEENGVTYDFVAEPWLGQALSTADPSGCVNILWYQMDSEHRWSKSKNAGRLYKNSVPGKSIIMFNFELDDGKIPENVYASVEEQLKVQLVKYRELINRDNSELL